MTISIHDIPEEGLIWEEEVSANQFSIFTKILSEEEIHFLSPISVRIQIIPRHGLFEISGIVKVKMDFVCGRCLDVFETSIEGKIYISYAKELPKIENTTKGEIELSADDMGIFLLKGSHIDISEVIEEQIILEIPFSPLCLDQCRGLCHVCGVNLNTQVCNCSSRNLDLRWETLRKLQRY